MRRRKRSFRNCWIAIRASPGRRKHAACESRYGFRTRLASARRTALTRVWGQTGSRPAAPKDLGFASAYLFGAVCPSEGKAAALIMPICNTAAMNHHLSEISSQVAADAHAVVILDRCRLAPQPRPRGARQYHFVGAAALQPGAQSGRADLALSAQPLARQLGVSQPGGHHGCLRDGLEPVRRRPRLDPLALRGRLGSGFARSIGGACYQTVARDRRHTRVQKFPEIRMSCQQSFPIKVLNLRVLPSNSIIFSIYRRAGNHRGSGRGNRWGRAEGSFPAPMLWFRGCPITSDGELLASRELDNVLA